MAASGGVLGKRKQAPVQTHSASSTALPIAAYRGQIVAAIRAHRVLVLAGATGSGKTTQLPAFIWRSGILADLVREKTSMRNDESGGRDARPLQIVVTQPRRVAAITVARRVAQEMNTPPPGGASAGLVGYSVRFDDSTGPATRIKFVTDGMLLR